MKWSSWRQAIGRNVRVAGILAAIPLFATACGGSGSRRVPAVEGRVVEATTGKPIQGAVFVRYLSQEEGFLAPGGSDVKIIGDSFERATSDAQGVFRLPSQWRWGPVYWAWAFYCPGRAAAITEAFNQDFVRWLIVERREVSGRAEMVFRVLGPTAPDEWGEYFRQLSVMTRSYWRERIIPADDFVKEATRQVDEGGVITDQVLGLISEAGGNFGGVDEQGRPCYRADLAWRLLALREKACRSHPELRCDPRSLEIERKFLEKECPLLAR